MTWNKCDACGKFIKLYDFGHGAARRLVTPDSHYSREEYETLCISHALSERLPAEQKYLGAVNLTADTLKSGLLK